MLRTVGLAVALAAFAFSSIAAGAPGLTRNLGIFTSPTTPGRGGCTAFYPNGDILMVSAVNGCGGMDFSMSRLNPGIDGASWTRTYDVGCMENPPHSVAMDGDYAYICGGTGTGSFLARIDGAGNLAWSAYLSVASEGVFDVATDPVDGTAWVAGSAGAPAWAYLFHYTAGGMLITQDSYQFLGVDTHAYALAVTADSIYMGGMTRDPSWTMNWPWIMKRDRATGTVAYSSRLQPPGPVISNSFRSLAVSAGRLFSLFVKDTGSVYSAYAAEVAVDGSGFSVGPSVVTDMSYAFPPPPVAYGDLVAHSSLPMLVAGSRANLISLDLSLNLLGSVSALNDGGTGAIVGGLAVDEKLNYTVAVSYTDGVSPATYARETGFRFGVDAKAFEKNDLLVAPNVLDLSKPAGYIRFVVKGKDPATAPAVLRVFDAAGNLVASMEAAFGSAGTAELRWDGRMEGGARIGPGSYVAVASGDSVDGVFRRSFLVTAGKGRK